MRFAQHLEGAGAADDWWAVAEQIAEVAQSVAGVDLTTAARAALVGMTVELLTVLTCWPNTARPAHPLAYLRARRARMARHVPWFYELPRSARWLLAGTGRVPSLLAFAVSAPIIDEESRQVSRKGLEALNGLARSAGDEAPELSARPLEPRRTGPLGCSDPDRRRRVSGCQCEAPAAAPQKSAAIATS